MITIEKKTGDEFVCLRVYDNKDDVEGAELELRKCFPKMTRIVSITLSAAEVRKLIEALSCHGEAA